MEKNSRERLFRLFSIASRLESRRKKRNGEKFKEYISETSYWFIQATLFCTAIALALAQKYFGATNGVAVSGRVVLLGIYALALIHPLTFFWANRRSLKDAATYPFDLLLRNAHFSASIDAHLIRKLRNYSLEDLELVLLEMSAEKQFFDRRLGLVVGAVEKVGITPGLLATFISIANVRTENQGWIDVLAYSISGLYILVGAAHFLSMRLDRFVKLLELAITRKLKNRLET